jgi:hypothetical protein
VKELVVEWFVRSGCVEIDTEGILFVNHVFDVFVDVLADAENVHVDEWLVLAVVTQYRTGGFVVLIE